MNNTRYDYPEKPMKQTSFKVKKLGRPLGDGGGVNSKKNNPLSNKIL